VLRLAAESKSFYIVLERPGKSGSISVRIPAFAGTIHKLIKLTLKCGLLFFVLYSFSHYYASLQEQIEVQKKKSLYVRLQHKVQTLDSMQNIVGALQTGGNQVLAQFGMNELPHDLTRLGVGGPLNRDSLFVRALDPLLFQYKSFKDQLSIAELQFTEFSEHFSNMSDLLSNTITSWRFIPSIKPAEGRYSSPYGRRVHPVTGSSSMHEGLDIANAAWTPIWAPADGVVERVRKGVFLGNYVVLNHGNGYITKFGHMSQATVREGQFVKRYQPIGLMGATGRTTGSHLHYEVHYRGRSRDPLNYILPPDVLVD
jgi:hypothetical protein